MPLKWWGIFTCHTDIPQFYAHWMQQRDNVPGSVYHLYAPDSIPVSIYQNEWRHRQSLAWYSCLDHSLCGGLLTHGYMHMWMYHLLQWWYAMDQRRRVYTRLNSYRGELGALLIALKALIPLLQPTQVAITKASDNDSAVDCLQLNDSTWSPPPHWLILSPLFWNYGKKYLTHQRPLRIKGIRMNSTDHWPMWNTWVALMMNMLKTSQPSTFQLLHLLTSQER